MKVTLVLVTALFALSARASDAPLYGVPIPETTRAERAVERYQSAFGMPLSLVRAAVAVPATAIAEGGNAFLWLVDQPLPGTLPHAEPGWMWRGMLGSFRDEWGGEAVDLQD